MKELIGIITVIMTIGIHLPYLIHTIQGKIKPHPFSWFIWSSLMAVAFVAQVIDGAGAGAWMNGATLAIASAIIFFSIRNGFDEITAFDKCIFAMGVLSIPLWILTQDPLASVIVVTTANVIAYIPTFRKAWYKPYEEALYLFAVNVVRHILAVLAIEQYLVTTALFPVSLVFTNASVAFFLIWRRMQLNKKAST